MPPGREATKQALHGVVLAWLLAGNGAARADQVPKDVRPQSAGAAATVIFPYPDSHGVAGILNTAIAFRDACLRQDWSEDLPTRLVPDGYRIVSRDTYWWGKDEGALPRAAILSHTGSEDSDKAGGFPVVDMMPKTDKMPKGACAATWADGWAGIDASQRRIAILDLAATTPMQLAYALRAVPAERPALVLGAGDRQSGQLTFTANCFSGLCGIRASWTFDPDTVSVTLERIEAGSAAGAGP